MLEEHFGMAVAEMVRAGCIVFVPRGGGVPEIVGHREELLYTDAPEAVQRIARVMGDQRLQRELRRYLEARGPLFSPERFAQELLRVVEEELRY
ncbi:MAG: glycosyltransferase [Armatimonadetes bacterium]|nr:glycosyltransferase [Armatimonadota bacterium]